MLNAKKEKNAKIRLGDVYLGPIRCITKKKKKKKVWGRFLPKEDRHTLWKEANRFHYLGRSNLNGILY